MNPQTTERRARPPLARTLLAALGLGALLLTVGCSGDDSEDASATSAATATTNPPVRHHELTPDEIETYQTDLDAVGCWAGPVDGILGPRTEAALREFQEAEGIPVTGLFGGESQGALIAAAQAGTAVCGDPDAAETASVPVEDAAVHELEVWQHDLNLVGCWAGPEDGRLGPQTEAAIRNFQTAAGLPVTGELDATTESLLAEGAAEGGQVCHAATAPTPDAPDDGGGAVAPSTTDPADDGGGAVAGGHTNCQVNSAGTWQNEQQALNYIAQLAGAGIRGFTTAQVDLGVIVLKRGLNEAEALDLIARLNAVGYSGRYFCDA